MRWIAILIFVYIFLPLDAQYWIAAQIPLLWETHYGRTVFVGFAAGSIPAAFWFRVGWNALARRLHREDLLRAETTWKARRWKRET